MKVVSRIPALKNLSYPSMSNWYGAMAMADLLFHPDDAPENIVKISDGTPTFSSVECGHLNRIMSKLFDVHGNNVYEAAYPFFMKALAPLQVG